MSEIVSMHLDKFTINCNFKIFHQPHHCTYLQYCSDITKQVQTNMVTYLIEVYMKATAGLTVL